MIGYAFMGAAHSHAWRTAPRFFDVPLVPELAVLVGRTRTRVDSAAERMGWAAAVTDWREVIERPDIDLIDICTPGDTHAEIAIAALDAGKHVLCEKPLANSVDEAERMAAAAERAAQRGILAMCGFTYRRTPALGLARQLIQQGRLGQIRHIRAHYLQDWLSDENAPLTWRMDKTKAGSGALGDIGAHIIDGAQHVTGLQITGVSALLETFVHERPTSGEFVGLGGHGDTSSAEKGPVSVDDAALFIARLTGGAIGIFEATRFALGRKNAQRLEINGSAGSLAFDFEDMNVLQFFDGNDAPETRGFQRIQVTEPVHPYMSHWWPPGHGIGYEHGFTHQVVDLLGCIAEGRQPRPSFADALQVQRVLAAVEDSARNGSSWQQVPHQ
jgi:predicted dehydrogenase